MIDNFEPSFATRVALVRVRNPRMKECKHISRSTPRRSLSRFELPPGSLQQLNGQDRVTWVHDVPSWLFRKPNNVGLFFKIIYWYGRLQCKPFLMANAGNTLGVGLSPLCVTICPTLANHFVKQKSRDYRLIPVSGKGSLFGEKELLRPRLCLWRAVQFYYKGSGQAPPLGG